MSNFAEPDNVLHNQKSKTMKRIGLTLLLISSTGILVSTFVYSQPPGSLFGFGGRGGPGGPGGPNQVERKLVKEHDTDGNGWLDQSERLIARKTIESDRDAGGQGRRRGGPGGGPGGGPPGRGGRGSTNLEGKPGKKVSPTDVKIYSDESLYDTSVLRTVFLEFENKDWEKELETFKGTDVDVPAQVTVDGKTYSNVGVHFRGASSYGHVSTGSKRSFNLSMDMADKDQRLLGYKTLNLLNSHGDPSMMSSVVYSHVANQYIPTPKANFVHVVVNEESWGLYDNVQQFDKQFLAENYSGSKGTRWKVSGSPNGDGGLRYLGDDVEDYKSRFEMKSNDSDKQWTALIQLCKTLNETSLEELEKALEPMLDVDSTLKFLALDVVLANSDGYWTRASDYNLFRTKAGKFHLIPHDMNEAFAMANHGGGPGGGRGGGPGGRGGPGFDRPGFDRPGFDRPGGFGGFGGFGFGPPPGDDRGRGGPDGGGQDREGRNRGGPDRGGPDRGGPDRGGPDRGGPDRGERGFGGPGGPGGRGPGGPGGGPQHGGVDLDPLVGIDNDRMPLRSRLLAVPALRERYMQYVGQIANESLDWAELGPVVNEYRELVSPLVKDDTRKLASYKDFLAATNPKATKTDAPMSYRRFAVERRKHLQSER